MAHFAEVNEHSVVVRVLVVPDEQEHRGQEYLADELGLGGTWLKTSYNTIAGKHRNGGIAYRKNYAGIGFIYDSDLDGFIPPKPYESWILNKDEGQWHSPTPYPNDGNRYDWDESSLSWIIRSE